MAIIYVRSTTGSDANNGSTWALAKATLAGAAAIAVAGDTVYVSQAHSESTASSITLTWNSTSTNPINIICANDGAQPPTALATTAVVQTTGTGAITLSTVSSASLYFYGVSFIAGSGGSSGVATIMTSSANACCIVIEQATLWTAAAGGATIVLGQGGQSCTVLINVSLRFGATSQNVTANGNIYWKGGAYVTGVNVNPIFNPNPDTIITIENVDLSGWTSTSANVVAGTIGAHVIVRSCQMNSSWVGGVTDSDANFMSSYEMFRCMAGTTDNYQRVGFGGKIINEGTLVRTGGANDGISTKSWKMVSTANTSPFMDATILDTGEIARWNSLTDVQLTATVEILRDSLTNLKNDEIWLEVRYLDSSSSVQLGKTVSNRKAGILTTAADQSTSTATWTTTGMTNPNTQKLSVTFTPQYAGFVYAKVRLAKPSTTVYVDPYLTIQ